MNHSSPLQRLVPALLLSLAGLLAPNAARAQPCPGGCTVAGVCYASGQANPGNPCQACRPATSQTAWTNDDALACNDGNNCTSADHCSAGSCLGTAYACSDGLACTNDVCVGDGTCNASAIVAGHCLIGGACYPANATNPGNPCQACKPATSQTAWTNDDALACNDGNNCTSADHCSAGSCLGTAYTCSDGLTCTSDACAGDGTCRATLDAGACLIAAACWATGAVNPSNLCEACDPAAATTTWVPRDGVGCDDGNPCTSGDTCSGRTCRGTPRAEGSVCGAEQSCAGAMVTTADRCSALAVCLPGTQVSCAPYSACADAVSCPAACDSSSECVPPATCLSRTCRTNEAPIARAGAPQVVAEQTAVTLDGRASSDADGDPLTFQWTQLSGPGATLDAPTSNTPSFTAPPVAVAQILVFGLVVSDGFAASPQVLTTVAVSNTVNEPPVARPGSDRDVAEGSQTTLDGSGSSDPNGDALTFTWSQEAGPAIAPAAWNGAQLTFSAPAVANDAEVVLKLVVRDGQANSAPALVRVQVRDVAAPGRSSGGGGCAGGPAGALSLLALGLSLSSLRRRSARVEPATPRRADHRAGTTSSPPPRAAPPPLP